MWHNIAEHKNKYQGGSATITGTGPSDDDFTISGEVLIGVNRSIALSSKFEYVFVDSIKTLEVIERWLHYTKYICMPIWSCEEMTQNNKLVQKLKHKILLFSLIYECPAFYAAPEYSLNDSLLHIFWGTVQPAIHFAKLLGVKAVKFYGCGGKPDAKGNLNNPNITKIFGINKKRITRTKNDYIKTQSNLANIADLLNLKIL